MKIIFRACIMLALVGASFSLGACKGERDKPSPSSVAQEQETVRLDIQFSDELSYTEMQAAKKKVIASLKKHGIDPGPDLSGAVLVPAGSYKYLERISGVERVSTY